MKFVTMILACFVLTACASSSGPADQQFSSSPYSMQNTNQHSGMNTASKMISPLTGG